MNYDDLIDSLHIAEPTRELCIKAADAIQQMIIDRNAFKDIAQKRADVIERMQKELHEAARSLHPPPRMKWWSCWQRRATGIRSITT